MSVRLADLTSPDAAEHARTGALLAVPLGATEQHGAHLPLSTDSDVAEALCRRLADARPDVVVAPAVPYGSSGEHAGFAGTISIGQDAIELVVLELGRSATQTFEHLLFVSAHGGNAGPVGRAVARLRYEGRDVSLFQPRFDGDAHAGHSETSLQLLLRPASVRLERAVVGEPRPVKELLPVLRSGGVAAVTATGVLGDPTGATAATGHELLDRATRELAAHVAAWRGDPSPDPRAAQP